MSRGRNGSALLVALLMAVFVGLALGSYLWLVSHQSLSTMRSLAWNGAIPVVEAGVEEALTQLHFSDIDHLSANSWTALTNGWYSKQHHVDNSSYYDVVIKQVDPPDTAGPLIVSTASVPAPFAPASPAGIVLAQTVPAPSTPYLKRRVRVNTARKPLFSGAMVAKGRIDMSGNNVTTDGFDSSDSQYNTAGKYDPKKTKASGDVGTNLDLVDSIGVGNANIKGHVATGPGGTVTIQSNGSVGDLDWVDSGTAGIKPGWATDDMHTEILDVQAPVFTSGYSTPGGQTVDTVNYDYVLDHSGDYKLANFSGKVLVSTNVSATLWVTDTFSFGPNDYILIAPGASLTLYVSAPTATIGGSGVINSDNYALSFQYYGLPSNTSFSFKANAAFTGAIYAPEADFTLGGGGKNEYDFVGACVVNTIKLNGHYHFHFDEALRKALWRGYVVTAWNEVDPNTPLN